MFRISQSHPADRLESCRAKCSSIGARHKGGADARTHAGTRNDPYMHETASEAISVRVALDPRSTVSPKNSCCVLPQTVLFGTQESGKSGPTNHTLTHVLSGRFSEHIGTCPDSRPLGRVAGAVWPPNDATGRFRRTKSACLR